jgi:ketosteroid isomerase-like protein
MSFDPMAAAVDWLDAYRDGDLETILAMHADDAVVHCGRGGMKTISGREGLRAYWVDRLKNSPAFKLDNLQPTKDGAIISNLARDGIVRAILTFNASGKIAASTCGPSN